MTLFKLTILAFALSPLWAWANVRPIQVNMKDLKAGPRWQLMSDKEIKKNFKGISRSLVGIKRAQAKKHFKTCMSLIGTTKTQAKSLRPWLAVAELECAQEIARGKKRRIGHLQRAITLVDNNKSWLLYGPQIDILREQYIKGLLLLLDKNVRLNRRKAWQTVDQLISIKSWMNKNQLAEVYKTAGELAFIQQNLLAAKDYYSRSLEYQDSRSLRNKLKSIVSKLLEKTGEKSADDKKAKNEAPPISDEENKFFDRMKTALESGDLVSAVEDGVTIIRKFPGGVRAEWATFRIMETFLSIANKRDSKYRLLKDRLIRQMQKCDGGRLYKWALNFFYKGYYNDALALAEEAMEKMEGHPTSTKITLLAGRAAILGGEYVAAEKILTDLYTKHSGSEAAAEGLFRMGLLQVRLEKYSSASSYFERLLAIPGGTDFDLQSMYWLWRAQQKVDKTRAKEEAQSLIGRYPLTYYGLRARAELNESKLAWEKEKKTEPLTVKLWMTDSERLAWERLNILLKAGWFKEAQAEIKMLPKPSSAEEKVLMAKLWANAFDHFYAVKIVNEAWDEEPSLMKMSILPLGFPKEFSATIEKESDRYKLDKYLITSLIKQESTFRTRAISSSNAVGLMQMVPMTIREIQRNLKWKGKIRIPDSLFDPETNIRFGTYYLSRLRRAFGGHVPLSLAAYNAGIGRMRKFLRAREDLVNRQEELSSNPYKEIWIDELPWSETSFYVKAILRNLMLYKMIDQGEYEVQDPIWAVNR